MSFDFQKDVIEASKETPIVVDFWAEWCGPCRMLGPVLEKLAAEANSTWKLVKVNTDQYPQIAMQYQIQGIPAVKMFSNGQVVAEFVGALPETHVRKWLDENLPSVSKRLLRTAQDALERGDKEMARELLEEVLRSENNNLEARVRLAELVFESDPDRAFELVKDVPQEHSLYKNAEAIQTLYRLTRDYEALAQQAKDSDRSPQAWQSYLNGVQALARRDYEEALKSWIDALLIDRSIDDDGPRRACVALFTWLGNDHELVRRYHRQFTSALF